jgi:PIN domain nuclease of toxin-antitoxin system
MQVLLDTHVVLWWLADDPKLGVAARQAIAAAPRVLVSSITPWEIAIKSALGKMRAPDNLRNAIADAKFDLLSITVDHAERVAGLPLLHGDPFDRMLLAQSLVEKARLITGDEKVLAYDVELLDARS